MRRLREWVLRLGGLFNKRLKDRELEEEIESHLQMHIEDNLRLGMTPEEARRGAMVKLGGVESMKEAYRDQRGLPVLETFWQDVRYGARMLCRKPGFTAAAVLTLALGIGANTAIFTLINALMLRSLAVADPEELVLVTTRSGSVESTRTFDYPFYETLRDGAHNLTGIFAAGNAGARERLVISSTNSSSAEFVAAQTVSGSFFPVLRVRPHLGRLLTPADDQAGNPQPVMVISHGFWQRRFGSDPSVVGRTVIFDELPFTIVGVAPAGFFGSQPGNSPDLWWPIQMIPQIDRDPAGQRLKEGYDAFHLMGRLAPGVKRSQAQAELRVQFQHWLEGHADSKWTFEQRQAHFGRQFELEPGHSGYTGLRERFRQPLLILMAMVAVVLLVACANVGSLMLARSASRAREFSVRSALGAGRLRIVRQLLTESMLLAGLGGLFGLLLAQGGTRALLSVLELKANPISFRIAPDMRVLLFTTSATLLTGMLFGLGPAFRSGRMDLATAFRDSAGPGAGGTRRQWANQMLVVVQIALSLVLLIGAGLFIRTLRNLVDAELGFDRENVVQFNLDFMERMEPARRFVLYRQLIARLEALPGVKAASLHNFGLLSGSGWTQKVVPEGKLPDPNDSYCQGMRVGPRFFETLGIHLVFGREFSRQDEQQGAVPENARPRAAIINEKLARRYFGDVNPLGKRFYSASRPEQKFEIVGVAKDAKYRSLRQESPPTFYVPFFQESTPSQGVIFTFRTSVEPRAAVASLESVVRGIDAAARVGSVKRMEEVVNASVHQERVIAQLGGFFSVFALGLACLGIYGLLSFAVTQRTREIGVRVALGAQQRDVLSLVIGRGLQLALIGTAIGLVGGLALTRLIASLLYGVTPTDPATWLGVSLLLVLVAGLASWLPARRAAKVDPMVALRYE